MFVPQRQARGAGLHCNADGVILCRAYRPPATLEPAAFILEGPYVFDLLAATAAELHAVLGADLREYLRMRPGE